MQNYRKYNFKNKKSFLKKRYLLISEIGMGSYSIVYISYDLKTKKYCAIKIFDDDSMIEGKLENKLYNKCNHNNIIKTIDNFIIDIVNRNILYKYYTLVFPLKNNNIRFINKKVFFNWMKDMILSINYLHNEMKICHTDIKPENFVLDNIPIEHLKIIKDYNQYIYLYEDLKLSNIEKTHLNILNIIYYSLSDSSYDSESSSYYSDTSDESSDSYTSDESSDSYTSDESSSKQVLYNPKESYKLILIDLGSSQKISKIKEFKNKYRLVQTRYYRSPEIILGLPYTEKIDIWSIACSLYELYTGEILFNPRNSEIFKTDHHHLYLITKLCGRIPHEMILKSPKKELLFSLDGSIKYSSLFPSFSLNIETKIKDKKIVNILKKCLIIDPNLRPSIKELLNIINII